MIFFMVSMLLLFAWNYHVHKAITHPAVAYAFVWFLQVFGFGVFSDSFIQCSDLTYVVIFLGTASFSLGGGLSAGLSRQSSLGFLNRDFSPFTIKALIVFIVSVGCLFKQYEIFSAAGAGESFAEQLVVVRSLMNYEGEDVYGVFKYGSAFGFVLLMLCVSKVVKREPFFARYVFLLIVFLVSFGFSVLSTGRGAVLQIILACVAIWVLGSGRNVRLVDALKSVFVIVFCAYFIFQVMGEAMGKVGGTFNEASRDIVDYQFSSIPALSYYLERNGLNFIDGEGGVNTFRFFNLLLSKVGFLPEPKSLIQEFVPVPVVTNIYTNYHLFIKDFGIVGLVVIPFFLGFVHSYVYVVGMRVRSDVALALIGILYLPLLQSISGESYITNISKWIQFVLLAVFLSSNRLRRLRG